MAQAMPVIARRIVIFATLAAGIATRSPIRVARAQSPSASCLEASDAARALLAERRLTEARARLRACTEAACDEGVRALCGDRLAEVAARIPSVVFEVKDDAGADVADATLAIDGTAMDAERWLGAEIALDPGAHGFTFTRPDGARVDMRLVLVEAEKARRERVVIHAARPVARTSDALGPVAPPPPRTRALQTAGWITTGAGAVALGIGIAFGVTALSKNDDADCDAANVCGDPRSRDDARAAATVSTVGVLGGVALILGGLAMVVFSPGSATGRGR